METQERIATKAHELFLRYGIRSVSMDEIAAHLGMSKKTIYQFYSDKDALVEAVIGIVICENKDVCFKQANECKDAVHEVFLGMDHVSEILANMNPLLMNDLEKYHHSTFKKLTEHKTKFFSNLVKENLEKGIKEGIYKEEINIEILSQFRVASTFLIFDPTSFSHGKHNPLQILDEITDNFLYGITNAKGQKLIQKYKQQRLKTLSV